MKTVPKNLSYQTSFAVMPKDCNYLMDMLCGGNLLYHMDIAAAMAVRRAFYGIELDTALTVGVDGVKFFVGASVGDLITLVATVTKVGIKSITVNVLGHRERKSDGEIEQICEGVFTYCAIDKNRKSIKHNLTLKNEL